MKAVKHHNNPDSYFKLVKAFPLKSISSDSQLAASNKMLDKLLSIELDSGSEDYLDALTDLIEKYESEHHDFGNATVAQVLAFMMEDRGLSQYRLAAESGVSKSTISEILSGKRAITIENAKRLGLFFGIAPSIFIDCSN